MEGVKIGALWKSTDKKGIEYLSGQFGDAYLMIYPTRDGGGGPRNRAVYDLPDRIKDGDYIPGTGKQKSDDGKEDRLHVVLGSCDCDSWLVRAFASKQDADAFCEELKRRVAVCHGDMDDQSPEFLALVEMDSVGALDSVIDFCCGHDSLVYRVHEVVVEERSNVGKED